MSASRDSNRNEADSPASSDAIYHLAREWAGEHHNEDEEDAEFEDMDYEPSSEVSDDDDDDGEMTDDGIPLTIEQLHAVLEGGAADGPDDDDDETEAQDNDGVPATRLPPFNRLRQFLQARSWLQVRMTDDDDDTDVGFSGSGWRRSRQPRGPMDTVFPKVPSDIGTELMASGNYGTNPYFVDQLKRRNKKLHSRLLWREIDSGPRGARKRASRGISQGLIPSSTADKIIHYENRSYSGQFSDDGNFFFCCSQDFKVRMYDTSNPYDWKYYKTVDYPFGQWTITDASLSPDNRFLAYSSIRNVVCLAPTDPNSEADPLWLDFARSRRQHAHQLGSSYFGIWSIRFSGDGREIVAGTSDRSVVVYDVETRESVLRLQNHEDDVNAVCFGDTSSPHILYSGSDDTTLRVWDRRSMGDGREAGVFMGHTEGLTYVDSKGDGRYVLSNGKDQTMKLWDLRKMMTTAKFDTINPNQYTTGFDYRYMKFHDEDYYAHPHDCSVVTFRGHTVLRTLIRCHFSPPESTNSRYVYTGSQDGKVYVYNMDATLAGVIDVAKSSAHSRPRDPDIFSTGFGPRSGNEVQWKTCVRDASWHPSAPIVAATSWNGWDMMTGTCTVHAWNDEAEDDESEPALGTSYDSELRYVDSFNEYADAVRKGYINSRNTSGNQARRPYRRRGPRQP